MRLALVLLVAGMWAQYGWQLMPPDIDLQGQVWNVSQSLFALLLIGAVACAYKPARWTCLLLAAYQVMVAGCSALWLLKSWPVVAGESQCSTRFHVQFGIIGMIVGLLLVAHIVRGNHGRAD